jgi:hypothetical protein
MSHIIKGGSLRAYAKHRASLGLPGGSLRAVQKAIEVGRISTTVVDGARRIADFAVADDQWRNATDPARSQRYARQPRRSESRFVECTPADLAAIDPWSVFRCGSDVILAHGNPDRADAARLSVLTPLAARLMARYLMNAATGPDREP